MPAGHGARQKALSGAGVADSRDAAAISLNPAGLANVDSQLSASASFFRADTGFASSGSFGFTAPGSHRNEEQWTVPANLAASWRVNWGLVDAVGASVSANERMRTQYADGPNPNCPPGFSGPFCGGKLGYDIEHTTASIGFAKQIMPRVSVGIAPFVTRQTVSVKGVGLFAGFSSDPAHFSNNGTSEAWGAGVRGGIEWTAAPGLRLGLAATSRTYMEAHNAYRGLMAKGADLDVPASVQAGVAYDLRPGFTVMADYKRIWYSDLAAFANPSNNAAPYGTANGPGFGWSDIDIFKLGLEWRRSEATALRAGYSYSTSLVGSRDADFNLLTPYFVQHHISAGVKHRVTAGLDLELSAMYGFDTSRTGNEIGNPFRTVKTDANQLELTAGLVYRFERDAKPAPILAPPPLK